ncbi:MAG: ATP-binding protein [Lentisphaeraceae bacterium]|nr:ATP-binding protein [Lentisphaeraceae bacterium]
MFKRADIRQSFNFTGGLSSIQATVSKLLEVFRGILKEEDEFALKMVLTEMLNNAVLHGNGCSEQLKVFGEVKLDCSKEEIVISVSDEGQGFNWKQIADDRRVSPDKDHTLTENGRGFMLVRIYGFSYEFNDKGNSVELCKRLESLK